MRSNLTDLAIQRLKPQEKQYTVWDEQLPAFGVRVSPRSKSFVVMYGKDRRLKTIGRYPDMPLKEARSHAKAFQVQKSSEGQPCQIKTFPEARSAFLDAKKGQITAHSHKAYTRYLAIFPFKGHIHEITKSEIREAVKKLDGKPHAQNMAWIALRTLMHWCLSEEYILRHPMHRAAPPNKVGYRKRVLTDDELRRIWYACEDDEYGKIVRILMLTAARREEVAAAVEHDGRLVFPETKNGTHHSLPITPMVRKHLALPFNFKRWSAYKKKLDERSGVTGWRLHDLRRTAASTMAKLKVSPHVIERVLNHKSGIVKGISLIYNQYNYEDELKEALLTLEAHIIRITSARVHQPEPSTAPLSGARDEVPEQA